MFLRLLGIETRKTLKHPALWLGLAALLFLLGMFMLSIMVVTRSSLEGAGIGLGYTQFLKILLTFLSIALWLYRRQDLGG